MRLKEDTSRSTVEGVLKTSSVTFWRRGCRQKRESGVEREKSSGVPSDWQRSPLILCSVFRSRAQTPPQPSCPPAPPVYPSAPRRECACVCISQLSRPPTPSSSPPARRPPTQLLPSTLPILTWHDSLSPPCCLLGPRGTGSLAALLPFQSRQPRLPSLGL